MRENKEANSQTIVEFILIKKNSLVQKMEECKISGNLINLRLRPEASGPLLGPWSLRASTGFPKNKCIPVCPLLGIFQIQYSHVRLLSVRVLFRAE